MFEDILYKTVFVIMLIVFPLFYLVSNLVAAIRFFKFKNDTVHMNGLHKWVNTTNVLLLIWCLVNIIIYISINYFSVGKILSDKEVDVWFYIPLIISVLLLLFKKIRRSVFSWIFAKPFPNCMVFRSMPFPLS